MTALYNRIFNQELRARMLAETEPRTTVSFYKYFSINNPYDFRNNLYHTLHELQIFGRVYISLEGINAQISVRRSYFNIFLKKLYSTHPQLDQLWMNVALDNEKKSFWVLRMKVRSRLIADGINDSTFNPAIVGYYLKAEEVNDLADDPDVLFLDMRNHYEYEIGHFNQAIEIPSATFREQLPMAVDMLKDDKDKRIVMYCTGGIRCEKASAWMLHNGFKNVFQVEGGIIKYVHCIREKGLPLKFIGKLFVFDGRMGERITQDIISYCHQCGVSCDNHTNCCNQDCHLLFIQCLACTSKYDGCCSVTCQKLFLSFKSNKSYTYVL